MSLGMAKEVKSLGNPYRIVGPTGDELENTVQEERQRHQQRHGMVHVGKSWRDPQVEVRVNAVQCLEISPETIT